MINEWEEFCAYSVFFFSAVAAASAFGAAAARVGIGAGRSSLVSGCGHTAAHRAKQAVITAVTMRFFIVHHPPF